MAVCMGMASSGMSLACRTQAQNPNTYTSYPQLITRSHWQKQPRAVIKPSITFEDYTLLRNKQEQATFISMFAIYVPSMKPGFWKKERNKGVRL